LLLVLVFEIGRQRIQNPSFLFEFIEHCVCLTRKTLLGSQESKGASGAI